MINLIFVRHAKAEDADIDLNDFHRSLTKKGKKDALLISDIVKKTYPKVELIISSPAFRAIETAFIFAENINYNLQDVKIIDKLYEYFNISDLFTVISDSKIATGSIMIFGHNPSISTMAQTVSKFSDYLPKCGVVSILLNGVDSNNIHTDNVINFFEYPKKYYK